MPVADNSYFSTETLQSALHENVHRHERTVFIKQFRPEFRKIPADFSDRCKFRLFSLYIQVGREDLLDIPRTAEGVV